MAFLNETGLEQVWGKIKTKVSSIENTISDINKAKVDKISGKGLSTNDYTTDEKNKLAGIATGATKVIVDSALNSTSTNAIQNKAVANMKTNIDDELSNKPSKTGDGASGTWGISISGNATTATLASYALKMQTYKYNSTTETYGTSYPLYAQWNQQGNILNLKCDNYTVNTDTATKATKDSADQQISTTYIKGLSVSGKTITYTKGDGTTNTITTQDTNTHYTTRLYAGASGTVANAAATNPYLKVTDDNTYRNQIQFKGGGATTVSSDANGVITISSTDTNTHAVTSVFGRTGAVTLTKSDVTTALGYTPPTTDTNTTYSAGTGLSLSGTTFSVKTGYTTSGKNYKVQADSSGNLYVNVPWTDTNTNTTYSAGTGLSLSGTTFSVKTGYTTSGKNYKVQADTSGNLYVNVPWTDTNTNTTYSAGTGLSLSGTTFSVSTVPVANGGTGSTSKSGARSNLGIISGTSLPSASGYSAGDIFILY